MGSPFQNPQVMRYTGTGNITDTLDAAGDNTGALAAGGWMIWATQPFYLQINDASGTTMGAKPTAWPANYPVYVQLMSTKYLGIKRISTDGIYYANRVSGPV